MKRLLVQLLIIYICIVLFGCSESKYEIYLSPNGDDNAIGSLKEPIATLQHASELASKKAGKIPVTIILNGGTYHLNEPLELKLQDSGNELNPVNWKAVEGENPVINGGIAVKDWKLELDGSWSVLLPTNFNGKFNSLYVNDNRAIRARHPNTDYLRINKSGEDRRTNFYFNKNDFPKTKNVSNLELIFLHDWSITRIDVQSIDWVNNQLFTVDSIGARLPFFKIDNWEKQPRYYLENAPEFFDTTGEWYCNYVERKIYYHPKPEDDINNTVGIIPVSTQLLTINGDSSNHTGFINFDGITFAYTNWEKPESGYCGIQACMYSDRSKDEQIWQKIPAAIELNLVENVTFSNCTIKHTGGSGIWIGQNSLKCEINDSHIYDIAGNGINVGEGSDRLVNGIPWWKSVPEQVSNSNRISNSFIEDCGKQYFGAVGIWCGLVSNTIVQRNEVRNLPYTGISIGWMWDTTASPCEKNLIIGNHIHRLMNKLSDGGGIYSLGQQPGSRINNNLIHDITVNAGRAESNGMFLDEGTRDLVIENNIIYNIARSPLRFHKAFNNLVQNNILVCGKDIPPIRYNRTKEDNIKKNENIYLSQSSEKDMKLFQDLLENRQSNYISNKK